MSELLLPPILLLPWVVSLEHFPEIAHLHLRVERGGLKVAVTEELLDVPDISPSFEQVGGTGMPERMGMDRMGEPGRPLVGPEKSTNPFRLSRLPASVTKKGSSLGSCRTNGRTSLK